MNKQKDKRRKSKTNRKTVNIAAQKTVFEGLTIDYGK
jgi:hypothetical protein